MRAFVDQIESGIATLLLGEEEKVKISLPVSLLPPETKEGAVLKITITFDQNATNDGRKFVQGLLDSLKDDS